MKTFDGMEINQFQSNILLLVSDVFRGYRKKTLPWNGLNQNTLFTFLCSALKMLWIPLKSFHTTGLFLFSWKQKISSSLMFLGGIKKTSSIKRVKKRPSFLRHSRSKCCKMAGKEVGFNSSASENNYWKSGDELAKFTVSANLINFSNQIIVNRVYNQSDYCKYGFPVSTFC